MKKEVLVIRGGQPLPIVLDNGDKYDSVAFVIVDGKIVHRCPYVNTDFTSRYKGGILAEGLYRAYVGEHKGYKALNIFRFAEEYLERRFEFLPPEAFKLPSLIPNPNHGGQNIIQYINHHRGSKEKGGWDWSHGCMTTPEPYYEEFIACFVPGEKIEYRLIRDPKGWDAQVFRITE